MRVPLSVEVFYRVLLGSELGVSMDTADLRTDPTCVHQASRVDERGKLIDGWMSPMMAAGLTASSTDEIVLFDVYRGSNGNEEKPL